MSNLEILHVSSVSLGCDQTVSAFLDAIYDEIVCVLQRAASYVPVHYKNYYKFWWNEELKLLKEYSVDND